MTNESWIGRIWKGAVMYDTMTTFIVNKRRKPLKLQSGYLVFWPRSEPMNFGVLTTESCTDSLEDGLREHCWVDSVNVDVTETSCELSEGNWISTIKEFLH
jgi:hypothetical protein